MPDKSDEMRVGLLTEICWGRQVCFYSHWLLVLYIAACHCNVVSVFSRPRKSCNGPQDEWYTTRLYEDPVSISADTQTVSSPI